MLELVKEAGSDVIGLDWHIDLGKARDILGDDVAVQGNLDPSVLFAPHEYIEILGDDVAVQGNLDPSVLFAPHEYIEKEVQRILDVNADRPGLIFNLGHGITPSVPPANAIFMVDAVHRLSQK